MRKYTLFLIAVISLLISVIAVNAEEETLTITTYYPSPYGSYNELRTNRMAVGYLDRSDACWDPDFIDGCLQVGANITDIPGSRDIDLIVEGAVGIGTTTPDGKLGVNGEINFVPQTAVPTGNKGDLYYDNSVNGFKYHNGTSWQVLGNPPSSYEWVGIDNVAIALKSNTNLTVSCVAAGSPIVQARYLGNGVFQVRAAAGNCDTDWIDGRSASCSFPAAPVGGTVTGQIFADGVKVDFVGNMGSCNATAPWR